MAKNIYDEEPVHYCAYCFSLNIIELKDMKLDMCGECGNVNVKITSIEQWELLYKEAKGKKFLEST